MHFVDYLLFECSDKWVDSQMAVSRFSRALSHRETKSQLIVGIMQQQKSKHVRFLSPAIHSYPQLTKRQSTHCYSIPCKRRMRWYHHMSSLDVSIIVRSRRAAIIGIVLWPKTLMWSIAWMVVNRYALSGLGEEKIDRYNPRKVQGFEISLSTFFLLFSITPSC